MELRRLADRLSPKHRVSGNDLAESVSSRSLRVIGSLSGGTDGRAAPNAMGFLPGNASVGTTIKSKTHLPPAVQVIWSV